MKSTDMKKVIIDCIESPDIRRRRAVEEAQERNRKRAEAHAIGQLHCRVCFDRGYVLRADPTNPKIPCPNC